MIEKIIKLLAQAFVVAFLIVGAMFVYAWIIVDVLPDWLGNVVFLATMLVAVIWLFKHIND